jgi:hypothetical protein
MFKLDWLAHRQDQRRPARTTASEPVTNLAARRARTLAPTIFCPSTQVEQCVRQASLAAPRE